MLQVEHRAGSQKVTGSSPLWKKRQLKFLISKGDNLLKLQLLVKLNY